MILDIITLVIILVFAIIGIKTGAAKAVCRLLAVAVSLAFSVFLSHFLAELVYNAFIKQTIMEKISEVISDSSMTTAAQKASGILSSMPMFLSNSLAYFGVTEAKVAQIFNASSAAEGIEEVIMTPIVGVISLVLFILLFFVLLFILRKIFGAVSKIFRLPVIRIADSVAGFALGLIEGVLVVCVLAFSLKLIMPLSGGNIFILDEAYISESYIFSFFYFGGIISFVQSFIYSFSNIN